MLPLQFTILTAVGVWCPPKWLSTRMEIFYKAYSLTIIILLYALGLSQLARIIFVKQKFSDFNDTFFILLSTNFACFKATCNLLTQKRVLKLIFMFEKYYCIAQDNIEREIIQKYDKICRLIELYLLLVVEVTALCMIAEPLYKGIKSRELIYKVLLPYDLSSPIIYSLTYLHHSLGALLFTSISITTDAVIVGFMLQLCSQIKLLEYRIKILPSLVAENRRARGDFVSDMENRSMAQNLKHHNHILEIAKAVCATFNEIATLQYIVSALSICVSVYQISATNNNITQLLIYVLYLWCMLVQFFFYCYFGNEVMIESKNLSTAVFNIDWSSLSINVQKELSFMILRSSKPIEMFKGSFVCLTLESFTNIVKKSYSVFTVLKQSL